MMSRNNILILLLFSCILTVQANQGPDALLTSDYTQEHEITFISVIDCGCGIPETKTGTVYMGKNDSYMHFALNITFSANNTDGQFSFAVQFSDIDKDEDVIYDRKEVRLGYNSTSDSFDITYLDLQGERHYERYDYQEDTTDLSGRGLITNQWVYIELNIPFEQTEEEPADQSIQNGDTTKITFWHTREYNDEYTSKYWDFTGVSEEYQYSIDESIAFGTLETTNGQASWSFMVLAIVPFAHLRKKKY